MEHQKTTETQPANMPTLQNDTQRIQAYERFTPIVDQKDARETITTALLAVWVNARIEIMQMDVSIVPVNSKEEFGLIERIVKQYGTITPSEFAECIRLAAIEKQRALSSGQASFPKLYAADFEEQIQKLTLKKLKEKENALELPANTGGNEFWGEPAEALAREWPKIAKQTKAVQQISPSLRDRFWLGGSENQRAAAVGMLRQMVQEMREADKWDQKQVDWSALAIFQAEYRLAYPKFDRLIESQMECPMKANEVNELRDRTRWKIQQVTEVGGECGKLTDFPDAQDCTFCAIMDAYGKFKGDF
jgi:hypothetical protein